MTPRQAFEQAAAAEGIVGTPLYDIALKTAGFESGWNPSAVSNRGATGLMQVMPATFNEIADQGWDINDPYANARAGIRYLKQGYEASGGDPALTGAYYYGGPGGMKAAMNGEARYDPVNPDYPSTLEYGQRLANAVGQGQGQQPMNTNFPNAMAGIKNRQQGLAELIPEPEFTPEVAELMSRKSRQDAGMLPLAVGAMLSGDRAIRGVGAQLYQAAQQGRNPVMLGDDAIIDPTTGKMVQNPMGDVNRAMRALPQAVNMYTTDQRVGADLTKAQAQLDAQKEYRALGFKLDQGQLNARNFANQLSAGRLINEQNRLAADPEYQYMMQVNGNRMPGVGGGAPLQIQSTDPGLPGAAGRNQGAPNAVTQLPPNAKMQYNRTTGQPVYSFGNQHWIPNPEGDGVVKAPKDVAGKLMSADKFQTAVGEAQGEAAALARNKRILEQMQSNPEAFSDFMAFMSGTTPHWMTDRIAKQKLSPEQYNLRVKILKDAAEAIHELYGAALTAGEENRAQQFSISNMSTPEKIFAALTKVPSYLDYRRQTYGKGVFDTALKNSGLSDDQLVFPSYEVAVQGMTGQGQSPKQAPEQTQAPEIDDDFMGLVNKWSD